MNAILKRTMWMLFCIIMAVSIVGCSSNSVSPNENVANEEMQTQQSGYPVTLTDSFGQEVTLQSEPERIISVAPNITEMIYALGAQEKLVARTDYCDYPEEVSNVQSIGTLTAPDMEKIISLEPDLVVTSTHFNDDNAIKLEQVGIPVMGQYEENNVEGVYAMLETLGTALNKKEAAADLISDMKATIQEVQDKVAGQEVPTVYYVVGYGEQGDFSAPENTFIGQLIELAGGKDIVPASESWSYSLEALLEADPDIIIVKSGDKEGFITADGYRNLTAVKNGQVYEMDGNLLERQGNRNAEGVLALAQVIHPDVFNQ